jgi:uncharacterized membrane protein YukC
MSNPIEAEKIVEKSVDDTTTPLENTVDTGKKTAGITFNWILIAVCIILVVLLIYYGYNRFVSNSVNEPYISGNKQERDDPVVDFNLSEAINELELIQRKIVNNLSDEVNM